MLLNFNSPFKTSQKPNFSCFVCVMPTFDSFHVHKSVRLSPSDSVRQLCNLRMQPAAL